MANQFNDHLLPSTTGLDLGSASQLWDVFARNASFTGTLTGTFDKLNNIRFAAGFAGANLGAKIAAAYTDLPSTGGIIIANSEGAQTLGSLSFTTAGKPVWLILGTGVYSFTAISATVPCTISGVGYNTQLLHTPNSGTAIDFTWSPATGGVTYVSAGMRDMRITGGGGTSIGFIPSAAAIHLRNLIIEDFGSVQLQRGSNSWNLHMEHVFLDAPSGAKAYEHPSGATLSGENNVADHCIFRNSDVFDVDGVDLANSMTFHACSFINLGVNCSGTTVMANFINPHFENADYTMGAAGTFLALAGGTTLKMRDATILHNNLGTAPTNLITKANVSNNVLIDGVQAAAGATVTNLISLDGSGTVIIRGVVVQTNVTNVYSLAGTWTGRLYADSGVSNDFFNTTNSQRVFANQTSGTEHGLSIRNFEPTATRRWNMLQRSAANNYNLRLAGFDGTNSPAIWDAIFSGSAGLFNAIAPMQIGSGTFADAEQVRLPNNTLMAWRNAALSANLTIGYNASDVFVLSGSALAIGTDPADAGTVRLPNAGSIQFEAAPTGTDVNALEVDSSEIVHVGKTGASAVTAGAKLNAPRVIGSGTALVAGDFALSAGWGTTASVGSVVGTDLGWQITVTSSGTGQGASPTITLTFKDGTFTNAPICISKMVSGTGTVTALTEVPTATTNVITFGGTPVAGSTYIIAGHTIGR